MNMKNHNDMNSKQSYSAPEAELLEVMFEENFLDSLTTDGSDFSDHGNVKPQGDDIWSWYNN